jgi:cytochrome oxidase assembly protein ShyY1
VALALAGVALFAALGAWQVRRGHEKAALFAAFAGAFGQPPVGLDRARREAGASRHPHVVLAGRYDPLHAWVLDDQRRDGRDGVMVYDLFEPAAGGPPLLANRGFLARDAAGREPAIPPPPPGLQRVDALYAPPPGIGLRLGGNALARQSTWPKTSIYLDLVEVAADLGRPLDPHVLLLAPEPGSAFVRDWKPDVFPPERHYAYAFTWFSFVAVVLAAFTAVHWRREPR